MKLIAKAKPVKIRIKSGGEEHTSLDSLKRNFNISDIVPLLDGRLIRWLKQLGENELADKISGFNVSLLNSAQGIIKFLSFFYSNDLNNNNIQSPKDLVEYWNTIPHYRRNSEYLCKYLIYNDKYSAKYFYYSNILPNENWIDVFSNYEYDGEVLYILGYLYFLNEDWQKAKIYIKDAMESGWNDELNIYQGIIHEEKLKEIEEIKRMTEIRKIEKMAAFLNW